MSLFPAYSDKNITDDTGTADWLVNSSFQANVPSQKPIIDISSGASSEDESTTMPTGTPSFKSEEPFYDDIHEEDYSDRDRSSKRAKKRKKEHRKHSRSRKKEKIEYDRDVENVYFEDNYRDKGNNMVNTLCSRVRPYYETGMKSLGFLPYNKIKKDTYQRYYTYNIDYIEKTKKKDTIIKRESTKEKTNTVEDVLSWCVNLEEEHTLKTREFNEKLTNDPNNINIWLQYIELQDTFVTFQKNQLPKDLQRAAALKKLSIVEKALEKNADSTELLKLRLSLMAELMPADQFSNDINTLVNKDSGNIILWQALIMATQGSVALCTVPKVLDLYTRCFCVLRQHSRTNPRVYDERLLEILHQCLTFLRHTGLWEQMWETIRLNLILNLNLDKKSLFFKKIIDEKKLISMEEMVLMSRLPLNQLWLRTEALRENCHWISVSREELELVGDSRRFVIPEDVADFVHPIITRNSNFRIAIYSLLALKVPLLPTRDYMLKELGLKECPWGIDSSEVLFPFEYPMVGEMAGQKERKALLHGIFEGHITSGPQYLRFHPAQEPYLDFIREIFRTIAESLPSLERTSMYIWWLRFERLLISLSKGDPLKGDNKGKKLRTMLKEFLKKEENRNNLYFYKEYALIEREIGRFENCVNILETAIQSNNTCPSLIANLEERAALFNLYRTLFEVLLNVETYKESHRNRILNVVQQMVRGSNEDQLLVVEKYLQDCVNNFLQTLPVERNEHTFLPQLECDMIACYAYFLYVKYYNIQKVIEVFTRCIEHSKELSHLQEMLYESKLIILQLHRERTQDLNEIWRETLDDMLHLYPDNFYALSLFATAESELPSWKLNIKSKQFPIWKAISLCLASRKRIHLLTQIGQDDGATACLNKLLSFHRKLARAPETRCCPLLWRMYMLLLREHNLCEKKGEEVYHESVALCPWARCVYIDAAEVAPQLLTQIQDVIREKELRMHVTPEELDILRGQL